MWSESANVEFVSSGYVKFGCLPYEYFDYEVTVFCIFVIVLLNLPSVSRVDAV